MAATLEWLRMRRHRAPVDFYPGEGSDAHGWNTRTRNLFSGMQRVDIDVANTCTHNCRFCGLYGPDAQAESRRRGEGRLSPAIVQLMSKRIGTDTCLDFIAALPATVQYIQFGGMGDPFTHPDMVRFIRAARRRGFRIEVLTNLAYLTEAMIEELHALGGYEFHLHFIVNLSAATPKTYTEVRPNQGGETFARVVRTVQRFGELRARDGGNGVSITLLSVVNRHNYRDMPGMVSLARELDTQRVWLKPMEIYNESHLASRVPAEELPEYHRLARETLELADRIGMHVFEREQLAVTKAGPA